MTFSRVSVIGLGYIGLPTAAAFASRKLHVIGVDVNEHIVDAVNRGEIHIVEPELDIVVRATVTEGFLRATVTPEPADAFLIAVPTPFTGNDHAPDLSFIEKASRAIASCLRPGNIVILESTSPVGATEAMAHWLADQRGDLTFPHQAGENADIMIAHCPERVLPGRVMQELVVNDRVIGGMTARCAARAASLYKVFVTGECIATNVRSAEMAKLVENAFRDVNIAFANELSMICDQLDINVWELIKLANRHPRVNILQPGPGVGGHCIAVDPWFIVSQSPELACLIRTARLVNDSKPEWVMDRVREAIDKLGGDRASLKLVLYGLAFKADIDDLRESPSLVIARSLGAKYGGPIYVIEPNINVLPANCEDLVLVNQGDIDADVHLLLVDHHQFIENRPKSGLIIDTRGIW